MKIKSLEFKNIGPYGNIVQHIDFSADNELINISAKNGSGKSTIINTINYVLYGKIKDLTLKDIVNRINKKNAWAKIVIEDNKDTYEIERGIAPSIFKVSKNSIGIDVSGKKNVQEFLEEEIYKMNFDVFTNTISLSVNDFKSFLTMSPADKRKIIDRLFGYHIINQIVDKVKKKRIAIDDDVKKLIYSINEKQDTINTVKDKISTIKNGENIDYVKENIKIKSDLEIIKQKYIKIKSDLEDKENNKNEKINIKTKISNAINEIKMKLSNILTKLKLYDNNKCPTCGSDLTTNNHIDVKIGLQKEKDILELKLNECKTKLDKAENLINNLKDDCYDLDTELRSLGTTAKQYQTKFESNKTNAEKNKDALIKQFVDLIKSTKTGLDELQIDLDDKKEKNEYYKLILEEILSEKGIRGVLTSRIINPLNILIQKYMNILEYDMQMKFDDNFDVEVKHLGNVINVKTLSTGERKKSDIIMILSFIELIKLQSPSNNCLWLDEIFSSLSSDSIEYVMNALKLISKKFNLNIFIVSHNNIERTNFSKIIDVKKENGFASFEIENIY